jgi:fructose-1,6-bisphosphatase
MFVEYANQVYPKNKLLSIENEITSEEYSLMQALSSIEGETQETTKLELPLNELTPTLEEEKKMLQHIQYNFSRKKNLESHAQFLNKFAHLRRLFARSNGRSVPIPSIWLNEMKKFQWPALKWEDLERIRTKKRVAIAEKLLN